METETLVTAKNMKITVKSNDWFVIKVRMNLKRHCLAFRMFIFKDTLTKIYCIETACDVLCEICLHFGVSIQIRKWCIVIDTKNLLIYVHDSGSMM